MLDARLPVPGIRYRIVSPHGRNGITFVKMYDRVIVEHLVPDSLNGQFWTFQKTGKSDSEYLILSDKFEGYGLSWALPFAGRMEVPATTDPKPWKIEPVEGEEKCIRISPSIDMGDAFALGPSPLRIYPTPLDLLPIHWYTNWTLEEAE